MVALAALNLFKKREMAKSTAMLFGEVCVVLKNPPILIRVFMEALIDHSSVQNL
jgi:hypothetical protein